VDVGFDGGSGLPVYRVKSFRLDRIWADTIDAKTGRLTGNATMSSTGLSLDDRLNLIAIRSVRQELADAVLVAEENTSGKALQRRIEERSWQVEFCDRSSVWHWP
jgi:hypothetical protein